MHFINKNSGNNKLEFNYLKSMRYWHRPGGGLSEVLRKMKGKNTTDPTLLDKSYIELYIGSLFATCLQESEKLDFWIGRPDTDPPDMALMTMIPDEKKRIKFHSREIEITRFIQGRNSLIDTILNKDIPYPGNYIIVCFLEMTGVVEFKKLSDQLVKRLKNIHHVFLLFHGVSLSELEKLSEKQEAIKKVTLVQLAPVFDAQMIDISDCLEKWRLDNKKLVYIEEGKVYYGLRDNETIIPKIIL